MRRGLSRVELAVVLGVLATALALATPALLRSRDAARKAQTQDNMRRLGVALFQERVLHPSAPRTRQSARQRNLPPPVESSERAAVGEISPAD